MSKFFIKIFFGTFLSWFIGLSMVVYVVDPLQFYRKSTFYKPCFNENVRYQNPGLARNYNYNAIILGTSLSDNFSVNYIDKKLGWNTLKLSISASLPLEQKLMFDVALKTGKIKNVIWVMDIGPTAIEKGKEAKFVGETFPEYLYSNNLLKHIFYLVNIDSLKTATTILSQKIKSLFKKSDIDLLPCQKIELENYNCWYETLRHTFGSKNVIKEFNAYVETLKKYPSLFHEGVKWILLSRIKENLDQNYIKPIKNNLKIQFYIVLPPYSILFHKYYYLNEPLRYQMYKEVKKYLIDSLLELPNVKIYNLQDHAEITTNLEIYKDLVHYSPNINNYIIDCIANEIGKLNPTNKYLALDQLDEQVKKYVLPPECKKLDS